MEADWSNAAFWYAAACLDSTLDIQGLNHSSAQGDACIAGCTGPWPGRARRSWTCPAVPTWCPPWRPWPPCGSGRTTRLVNAARLRIKESDRLSTVTEVLTALGAEVEEHADHLVIPGRDSLPGGVTVSGHNDHRIAMMAAIAATNCDAPVTVTGAECVSKSYPDFWEEYARLGGQIAVSDDAHWERKCDPMKHIIFGESHGPAIGVVLEGVPAGLGWIWTLSAPRWPAAARARAPCPPPGRRPTSPTSSPASLRARPPAPPCAR